MDKIKNIEENAERVKTKRIDEQENGSSASSTILQNKDKIIINFWKEGKEWYLTIKDDYKENKKNA